MIAGHWSRRLAAVAAALFVCAGAASAGTISVSYLGMLPNPESYVLFDVTLPGSGQIIVQTYGFGGGTNAANEVIPEGGFDPFVGPFSGTGPTAVFYTGYADTLFGQDAPGCPPAGTVTVGSVPNNCGDIGFGTNLDAGTYTVLLSDALYLPAAVFETGPPTPALGDGFDDLSAGVFPPCAAQNDCNNDTGNWAIDVTFTEGGTISEQQVLTPEPSSIWLCGGGIVCPMGVIIRHRTRFLERPKIEL
jgi:hypothetical protein